MKLKLTLRRSGRPAVDLTVTTDPAATVGALAEHLDRADPTGRHATAAPGRLTLAIVDGDQRALDPDARVADSPLRSGATIAVATAGTAFTDPLVAAAVLRVESGPDRGREFALRRGSSMIGRDRDCEVRLTDPLVSRRHARVNISESAQVVDAGSANGVQLGGAPVTQSVLRSGDLVRVGDTEFTVRVTPVTSAETGSVGFIRSPRLAPRYAGEHLVAPEPPAAPQRQRFPFIGVIFPVIMGAGLYLVTRSLLSLLFVALSPMMMVGYALESMLAGRSAFKRAVREFRTDLAALVEQAGAAAAEEQRVRALEHPSLADCVTAARTGSPLLWTRRPGDPGFCEVRLGLGAQPSRSTVEVPSTTKLPRDLMAELHVAVDCFGTVADVPVVAELAESGALGLAGYRPTLLDAARAVLVQLAVLHSPAELVVVGFASAQRAADWDWLKWLPHTTSPHSPLTGPPLASNAATASDLLTAVEELLETRAERDADTVPAILVLVEDDAPVERSRLVALAEHGAGRAVHVVWLAPEATQLPAACRVFVSLTANSPSATAGFVHDGSSVAPLTVDLVPVAVAGEIARRLAPLVDTGARVDDDSDLPRSINLMAVPELNLTAEPASVLELWQANRSIVSGPYAPAERVAAAGTLRAVIGRSAAGAHALDLRRDGPHALVGGTTGSGKSELLQAWILAMALAHSPQRLTFLLVDYKGGAAFKEFTTLPHTIGLVTDLSPHLVRRALTSLHAELRGREELFHAYNAKDLEELERKRPGTAPPSLVIVVDEFAALVKELPEFVDGVVNVAQRGRSLGVHLILATQRPAGVIKDNLRANTNLRIALRTADEADSTDVLGSPQAALFDPALPGRAVSKTGPGRLVSFQTGYVGGWTPRSAPPPDITVQDLRFGNGDQWQLDESHQQRTDTGPTDIVRLVDAVRHAFATAELAEPVKPWLPELRGHYNLLDRAAVPWKHDDESLVFAIKDFPEKQSQPAVAFQPDTDGNLAVYGTGGSGKSTLLRTLAITAGFTIHSGPCQVYGLDFGARGLAMLAELPHVGDIIEGHDHERVVRLLRMLRALIDDRAARYSRVDAGSLTDYRKTVGDNSESRILLLVDGIGAFRSAYENSTDRARWFDTFVGIAADGRPVGVHVVLSADRLAAIPAALGSAVQTRVVLRMADPNDYAMFGAPMDVLGPGSPPGRGLLHGDEIQIAMLGARTDVGSQAVAVRRFAEAMTRSGHQPAPAVERLADLVPLASLPASVNDLPVLGLASDSLAPQTFQPSGTFLIGGPPGSGRSTALRTVIQALRRWRPDVRLHYFGSKRSSLAAAPYWQRTALDDATASELATELTAELVDDHEHPTAIVLENVPQFAGGNADAALVTLVRRAVEHGVLVLAEGETATLTVNMGVLGAVKSSRVGLALAPDSMDGVALFRTPFPPRLNRADFPPGRALYVTAGRTEIVQTALSPDEPLSFHSNGSATSVSVQH